MDAVRFVIERRRMFAVTGENPKHSMFNMGTPAEEVVREVEEWATAHPRKTRQSVFLEQFPNAPVYPNTHNVALDQCLVDTTLRGHCPTGRGCDNCCREFWMQEVE